MLKLSLVVLIFTISLANCDPEHVPVFMWGAKEAPFLPALKSVKPDEFSTIVEGQTNGLTTLVFVEPKLTVEDLSHCKLKTHTCFQHLSKVHHKSFMPNVEDSYNTLLKTFPQRKIYREDEEIQPGEVIFVYLDQAENNEAFAAHDQKISHIFHKAREGHKHVVAIYTSKSGQDENETGKILKRRARDVSAAADEATDIWVQDVKKKDEQVIFALATIQIRASGKEPTNLPFQPMTMDVTGYTQTDATQNGKMTVSLKSGADSFDFNIMDIGQAWVIDKITYQAVDYSIHSIHGNTEISYACNNFTVSGDNMSISFLGLQIQPNFMKDARFVDFGYANNCVGFFSAAIWGGLFVVFLLIAILITGLSFIMDIRTMDKFDDPKGKTITINAQE